MGIELKPDVFNSGRTCSTEDVPQTKPLAGEDPEFDLIGSKKRPGSKIGTCDAADVNYASAAYAASGNILGNLKDQKGAAIRGGTVEAKNLETGSTQSAVTDSSGQYSFNSLPEGHYSVSASYQGFEKSVREDVTVRVDQDAIVDFTLSLDRIETVVVVTAPVRADVVSEPEISKQTSYVSDSAQLLQDIPGVSVYSAGGVSSLPVVHGLADDRLRIKVDGMDLISSCPNHMNSPLSYVDPTSIRHTIKVYTGISPVSLGGDSIGAVIVADTKDPHSHNEGQGLLTTGEAGTRYRSNGRQHRGLNVAVNVATADVQRELQRFSAVDVRQLHRR